MIRIAWVVAVPILVANCTHRSAPQGTPRPGARSPYAPYARALPPQDWRHALVGRWTLSFRLDVLDTAAWRQFERLPLPRLGRTAGGSLEIRDTLVREEFPVVGIWATFTFDFGPMLGREPRCTDPTLHVVRVDRTRDSVTIDFSPRCADMNLVAWGALHGDSLVGQWAEGRFSGPLELGAFLMRRAF